MTTKKTTTKKALKTVKPQAKAAKKTPAKKAQPQAAEATVETTADAKPVKAKKPAKERVPGKLSALDAVVEAVAEFGLHREPLQPAMLRSEHDRGEWEEQLARVRLEIRGWVEKEPYRNFNFAAATRIWREGLLLNNENETLLETLKRLRVKL